LYELLIQIKNIFFVHPAAADDWGIFFLEFLHNSRPFIYIRVHM